MNSRALPHKAWHDTKLKLLSEIPDVYFYQLLPCTMSAGPEFVELAKVVGTTNTTYHDFTWSGMFNELKDNVFYDAAFVASPDTHTLDIIFQCIEGEHFILDGGNHRTCITKFEEERPFIKVNVERWQRDNELLDVYNYFQAQRIKVTLNGPDEHTLNRGLKKILEPHWHVTFDQVAINLKDREAILAFYDIYLNTYVSTIALFKAKLSFTPTKQTLYWPLKNSELIDLKQLILRYKHQLLAHP